MQIPTQMRAMESASKGMANLKPVATRSVPWPPPTADSSDVLVKVEYTALNPIDWKLQEFDFLPLEWPASFGCDMSGTVAAAPEGSPWKIGDRVWAFTGLGRPQQATFAEYVRVPGDVLGAVPDGASMATSCTIGLGIMTACIGLFTHLPLSMEPSAEHAGTSVLVYGASSMTGWFTIAMLKSAGYRVVAVASAKHHTWLKETLGADECWDYKEDGWVDAAAAANPGIAAAYDTIGGPTTEKCDAVLQKAGGASPAIATVDPFASTETKSAQYGVNTMVCYDEKREDCVKYVRRVSELVASGALPLPPIEELESLEAVPEALQRVKDGKVSGKKVVAKV